MEALHGGDFDVVNATLRGMDLLQRHTSGIVLQYVFYEPPAKGVLRESWAPPQTQPIDWLSAAMAGDFEGPTSRTCSELITGLLTMRQPSSDSKLNEECNTLGIVVTPSFSCPRWSREDACSAPPPGRRL
jgi:hypothetical protein